MHTRPRAAPFLRTIAALAFLAPAACATTGQAGGEGTGEPSVRVENDLVPPSSLTISLVGDDGIERPIGIVPPSSTRVIEMPTVVGTGRYRLVAETTAGAEISSRPFFFADAEMIEWDLSPNTIEIVER